MALRSMVSLLILLRIISHLFDYLLIILVVRAVLHNESLDVFQFLHIHLERLIGLLECHPVLLLVCNDLIHGSHAERALASDSDGHFDTAIYVLQMLIFQGDQSEELDGGRVQAECLIAKGCKVRDCAPLRSL
jgi:hypothetical protein